MAAVRGNGLGVAVTDIDDDGWPDVFVANDATPNFLFHNTGGGRFTEMASLAGVAVAADGKARAGMGTAFADFSGNGRPGLIVTNHETEMHSLFLNVDGRLFSDVTVRSGVGPATRSYVGFGVVFFDYDNDTRLDIAIANGNVMANAPRVRAGAKYAQRNLLLRNTGERFQDMKEQAGTGFSPEMVSRALAAGDIDNDGDLDLLITNNNGRPNLLLNEGGRGQRHPGACDSDEKQPRRHRHPTDAGHRRASAGPATCSPDPATLHKTICVRTSAWASRIGPNGWKSAGPAGRPKSSRVFRQIMSLRCARARVSSAGCRSGAEGTVAMRPAGARPSSVLVAALVLALLVVPSTAFAQRDAFFSALLVFYKTLGGVYGDEGPQLVAHLAAISTALERWDDEIRAAERQLRPQLDGRDAQTELQVHTLLASIAPGAWPLRRCASRVRRRPPDRSSSRRVSPVPGPDSSGRGATRRSRGRIPRCLAPRPWPIPRTRIDSWPSSRR